MYQQYYGLTKNPFHTTPDPDFLYLSSSHKQALGTIIYGIEERKGFIAVLGEVGLGKTTILRSVRAQIDRLQNRIIYLLNPNLSFRSFLQTLLRELCQPMETQDEAELVSQLHRMLIDEYEKGKTVVIFIDEAQNMPVPTLEGLRLLSNLETEKEKLIQIVLVGQPELSQILERHELRQLDQRIAIRATIFPLTKRESYDYIQHRLTLAGAKKGTIFSKGALSKIVQDTNGNPRQINRLCDNALVTGVGYNNPMVTKQIVKEVIADMQGTKPKTSWTWFPAAASLVGALLVGGWLTIGKAVGPLEVFFSMNASEIISYLVKYSSIATEGNKRVDYGSGLVMESQAVSSQQTVALKENRTQEFLPQNEQKNIANLSLEGGQKIRINQENTLFTENKKKLFIKDNLSDKLVAVDPKSSKAKDTDTYLPRNRVLATKVVREGDTLEKLLREVYGVAGPKKAQLVLSHNPHLESAKKIFPDQIVAFPSLDRDKENGKVVNH